MKIYRLIITIILLLANIFNMHATSNDLIVTISYETVTNENQTEFLVVLNIENQNDNFLEIDLVKTNLTFEIINGKGIEVERVKYIPILDSKRPTLTLRPSLNMNIQLGKIIFNKKIKPNTYSIKGLGSLMVNNKPMDFNTEGQLFVSELLIEISLEPLKTNYESGGKLEIVGTIINQNNFPIALMNKFTPTKDYFDITINLKETDESEKKEEGQSLLHIKSAKTLPASQLWLWLYPGESVNIPLDIEIEEKGKHEVSIEYTRKILIKKKGVESYCTEQFKWPSNQLEINIK